MFQRMRNHIVINVPEVDMMTVSDIQVNFYQRSTETSLNYEGENVEVVNQHQIVVYMPKEDAMLLDKRPVNGQVMFMRGDGLPDATKIFTSTVDELQKEDGYGD